MPTFKAIKRMQAAMVDVCVVPSATLGNADLAIMKDLLCHKPWPRCQRATNIDMPAGTANEPMLAQIVPISKATKRLQAAMVNAYIVHAATLGDADLAFIKNCFITNRDPDPTESLTLTCPQAQAMSRCWPRLCPSPRQPSACRQPW